MIEDPVQSVRNAVRRYYGRSLKSQGIGDLLAIVMKNQIVQWRGTRWLATVGIATGLAAGVLLANIFMADCDQLALDARAALYYGRFVDDGIAVIKQSRIPQLLEALRGCHPYIQFHFCKQMGAAVVVVQVCRHIDCKVL